MADWEDAPAARLETTASDEWEDAPVAAKTVEKAAPLPSPPKKAVAKPASVTGSYGAMGENIEDTTSVPVPAPSVMDKLTGKRVGPVTTSPLRPEVRSALEAQYDAATPKQRQTLAATPGAVGDVMRARQAAYATQDKTQAPTKEILDPRAEARRAQLISKGEKPEFAAAAAKRSAEAGALPGQLVEEGLAEPTKFDFDMQKKYKDAPAIVRGAVAGYEGYKQGALGVNQALFDLVGADEIAKTQGLGAAESRTAVESMGKNPNYIGRMFEGAVGSIAQQLPALTAGTISGSEALVLGTMFTQSFGQEYSEGKAKGLSGVDAATRAGLYASFEVLGEKAGLKFELDKIKKATEGLTTDALKGWLGNTLKRELPGEYLTTTGQYLTDLSSVGLNKNASFSDYLGQMADTTVQTLMQGGVMSLSTAGVGAGVKAAKEAELKYAPNAAIARAIKEDLDAALQKNAPVSVETTELRKPGAAAPVVQPPVALSPDEQAAEAERRQAEQQQAIDEELAKPDSRGRVEPKMEGAGRPKLGALEEARNPELEVAGVEGRAEPTLTALAGARNEGLEVTPPPGTRKEPVLTQFTNLEQTRNEALETEPEQRKEPTLAALEKTRKEELEVEPEVKAKAADGWEDAPVTAEVLSAEVESRAAVYESMGYMRDDAEMLARQDVEDKYPEAVRTNRVMERVAPGDEERTTTDRAERAAIQATSPETVLGEPPANVTEEIPDEATSAPFDRGLASAEKLTTQAPSTAPTSIENTARQIQNDLNRDPYADVGWALGDQWVENEMAKQPSPEEYAEAVFNRFEQLSERGHEFGAKPIATTEKPSVTTPAETKQTKEERPEAPAAGATPAVETEQTPLQKAWAELQATNAELSQDFYAKTSDFDAAQAKYDAVEAAEAKKAEVLGIANAESALETSEYATTQDAIDAYENNLEDTLTDAGVKDEFLKSHAKSAFYKKLKERRTKAEAAPAEANAPLELEATRNEELEVDNVAEIAEAYKAAKEVEKGLTKAGTPRQRAPGGGRTVSETAKTSEERKDQQKKNITTRRPIAALIKRAKDLESPTGRYPTEEEYDYAEARRMLKLEHARMALYGLSLKFKAHPVTAFSQADGYIRGLKPAERARAKGLWEGTSNPVKLPVKPKETLSIPKLEQFRRDLAEGTVSEQKKRGRPAKEVTITAPSAEFGAPAKPLEATTKRTPEEFEADLEETTAPEAVPNKTENYLKSLKATMVERGQPMVSTEYERSQEMDMSPDPNFKQVTTLREALLYITTSPNPVEAVIAARLLQPDNAANIADTGFKVVEEDDTKIDTESKAKLDDDAVGLFVPTSKANMVYVRGDSYGEFDQGMNPEIVLHEALHAVGSKKIAYVQLARAQGEPVNKRLADAVDELEALRARAKATFDRLKKERKLTAELRQLDRGGAFTDANELFSYGMTNPAMKSFLLHEVPGVATKSSGFDALVDATLKLFGIDPMMKSGLKDLVLISNEIMQAKNVDAKKLHDMAAKQMTSLVNEAKSQDQKEKETLRKMQKNQTADDLLDDMGSLSNVARHPELWADYVKINYRNMATPAYAKWLMVMPTNVLIDTGEKLNIGGLRDVDTAIRNMDMFRTKALDSVQNLATPWIKLKAAEQKKLSTVMHESTLMQVDPSANKSSMELNRLWNALTPEAKKIYTDVRDYYKNSYNLYRGMLRKRVDTSGAEGDINDPTSAKGKLFAAIRGTYETGAQVGPYFPLMRYGTYWAKFGKGPATQFHMFEDAGMRDAFIERRVKELNTRGDRRTIEKMIDEGDADVGNSLDAMRDRILDSSQTLKSLFDLIDSTAQMGDEDRANLKNEVFQLHLMTLPESSFRKQFITRKGTAGFSGDALRNFINSGTRFSNQLARIKYGPTVNNGVSAADASLRGNPDKAKLGMLVDEIRARAKNEINPTANDTLLDDAARITNKFAYLWLLTSVKSAGNQLFSLVNFTLPTLAKHHGWGAALAEGVRMAATGYEQIGVSKKDRNGNVTYTFPSMGSSKAVQKNAEETRAYQEMMDRGIVSGSRTYDLFLRKGKPTADYNSKTAMVTKVMGAAFQGAERMSREIAFMSAFRLGKRSGMSYEAAVNHAIDVVNESLFDYSAWNAPRALKSAPARVVTQFMKFPLFASIYLARNFREMVKPLDKESRAGAAKAFFGTLGLTAAGAGVTGMVGYSVAMAIAQGLHNLLRDDDDEEILEEGNVKKWFENIWIPDHFGNVGGMDLSELFKSGALNAATGYDFASGISMDFWLKDSHSAPNWKNAYVDFIMSHLGPGIGAWGTAASGIDDFAKGDYKKGVEKMVPAFFRGSITASRYATEGAKTGIGAEIKEADEFTNAQLAMQALGYKTTGLAELTADNFAITQMKQAIKLERQGLLSELNHAAIYDDDEAFDKVRDKIDNFKDRYPDPKISISNEEVQNALKARQKLLDKSERGLYVEKEYQDLEDLREHSLKMLEAETKKRK